MWLCSVNVSFVIQNILYILALLQSNIFQHFITLISSIRLASKYADKENNTPPGPLWCV